VRHLTSPGPGEKGELGAPCTHFKEIERRRERERRKEERKTDRKKARERERERKKLETSGLILPVTANNVLANFQTSNCLKT